MEEKDCLIIGGGPAELTAAVCLARYRRNVVLLETAMQARFAYPSPFANRLGSPPVVEGFMDADKKPDEDAKQPKQDVGQIVGDLVVSGATVLAHSAAEAVVKRVRKAAAKSAPKAVAKVAKKAKKLTAASKAAKSKKVKKASKKSGRKKSTGKKKSKKSKR